MKLHHNKLSSSSRRVMITARLLGLSFDEQIVDLRDAVSRAALTKINPNTKVPVLEDGDFVLWESIAIMQYLCDQTPGQTLYPTQPRARAEVNRWLSWGQAHWGPAIGGLGWENVWKKLAAGLEPDPEQVKRHETFFNQFAAVLDGHLANRAFIVGDALTLADIAIATPLMMTRPARLPVRPFTQIGTWFSRIQELPAWQATEPPPIG